MTVAIFNYHNTVIKPSLDYILIKHTLFKT